MYHKRTLIIFSLSLKTGEVTNPYILITRKKGILVNSENPDEMPHDLAFHQSLHCLQRLKQSSRQKCTTV